MPRLSRTMFVESLHRFDRRSSRLANVRISARWKRRHGRMACTTAKATHPREIMPRVHKVRKEASTRRRARRASAPSAMSPRTRLSVPRGPSERERARSQWSQKRRRVKPASWRGRRESRRRRNWHISLKSKGCAWWRFLLMGIAYFQRSMISSRGATASLIASTPTRLCVGVLPSICSRWDLCPACQRVRARQNKARDVDAHSPSALPAVVRLCIYP